MPSDLAKKIAEETMEHYPHCKLPSEDCRSSCLPSIIDRHLGKEVSMKYKQHGKDTNCILCNPIEEEVKTWPCEHIPNELMTATEASAYSNMRNWFFCPICGARKPKEEDLVEELASRILPMLEGTMREPIDKLRMGKQIARTYLSFLREKGKLRE